MADDGTCIRRHPLKITGDLEGAYTCDICQTAGIGRRPRCDKCNFDAHPDCMDLPPTITVKGYKCRLHVRPYARRIICDACSTEIEGNFYHCDQDGVDFHPRCAKLEDEIEIDGAKFTLKEKGPFKCEYCNRKRLTGTDRSVPGWSYTYMYNGTSYDFHVHCVKEMALNRAKELRRSIVKKQPVGRGGSSTSKWLKMLAFFLRNVVSVLLGDPTPFSLQLWQNCLHRLEESTPIDQHSWVRDLKSIPW